MGSEAIDEQFGLLCSEYAKVMDGFIGQSWGSVRAIAFHTSRGFSQVY